MTNFNSSLIVHVKARDANRKGKKGFIRADAYFALTNYSVPFTQSSSDDFA